MTSQPQWIATRKPEQAIADAIALFQQHFGGQPAGVWSAPGRANLIGEHVDYAAGICLPFALNQRTYIAAKLNNTGMYRLVSRMVNSAGEETVNTAEIPTDQVGVGQPADWSGYVVGTVWAAMEAGVIPRCDEVKVPGHAVGKVDGAPDGHADGGAPGNGVGIDFAIESDVPLGAGLSSSAALECSTAIAAWELLTTADSATAASQTNGTHASGAQTSEAHTAGTPNAGTAAVPSALSTEVREALMHAAIRAENEVVGASTGGLDQRISLFGQAGHVLAIDFGEDRHYQVPCDFQAHDVAVLVTNTNAPHVLADGQYASRRAVIDGVTAYVAEHTGHPTLRSAHQAGIDVAKCCELWALENAQDSHVVADRVEHVIGEIQRTARAIELLQAGDMQALGQAINESHESLRDLYRVSCPELDVAVEAARGAGALGSRMVGGGFGGSAIAVIPVQNIDAAVDAIASAFSDAGFVAPEFLIAVAGEGAHRNQ